MANEAQVVSYFRMNVDQLDVRSRPERFYANISDGRGPFPGVMTAGTSGTTVDLSNIRYQTPALCKIQNISEDYYVDYGLWVNGQFWPLGELLPGEHYVIRLSRYISFSGDGVLQVRADTADAEVVIEAYAA